MTSAKLRGAASSLAPLVSFLESGRLLTAVFAFQGKEFGRDHVTYDMKPRD